MKKLLFTLLALLLSSVMMAGNFVMISYSCNAELEHFFSDSNLTVHYYTDSEIFATAKHFDSQSMVLLDENAFSQNEIYTIVYCPDGMQDSYLAENKVKVILQSKDYILVKGSVIPYKNDGAVAIFNKTARLPRQTRDFPQVTEENPIIRDMLDQVSMDSLEAIVQHLQDYGRRIWNSNNAFAASDWIADRMEALGLEVEQQPFYAETAVGNGQAAPNVIGIQRGALYPDTYVVCGSHFDSFNWDFLLGAMAPGADDNATGVASVLESARIMSKYEFEYSIIYCAFGCEEMGLVGSEVYASRCQQENMDIIGYFNNDMNGYLYGNQIHIDCIYPNAAKPIGTYYKNVGSVYYPELPIRRVNYSGGDSDHTSFNNHGYMGIFPFEDYQHSSPYIHTTNDVIGISVTSFEMSQQYCRMNIACLAEIASPQGIAPSVRCNPVQNFHIEEQGNKETTTIDLVWEAPEAGSTGILEHFDLYRDAILHASLGSDVFHYQDTITIGVRSEYYIIAVYSDGCESVSDTIIGNCFPAVGEIEGSPISLYPNPATHHLNIIAKDLQRVNIYNILGQLVETMEMDCKNACVFSVENYPAGIYKIQLVTANGTYSKSMVIE